MEPAYRTVIAAVHLLWRTQGLHFTITGMEASTGHRRGGGGVEATFGYLDFTFAGLPFFRNRPRRLVRFMASRVFDPSPGPIMRSLRHPGRPGQRRGFLRCGGRCAQGRRTGGCLPGRRQPQLRIKEFKSGAARMAIAADVPIIPHIVWGAQRIWTKDHPKKLWRTKVRSRSPSANPSPTLPPAELTKFAAHPDATPARAGTGCLRALPSW